MKRTAVFFTIGALCFSMALGTIPSYAYTARGADAAEYDYTCDGLIANNRELMAVDMLRGLGYAPGEIERAYLAEHEHTTIRYSEMIGGSSIDARYSEEGNTLEIAAHPYTYSHGGKEVTWLPVSADGIPLSAENGYTASPQVGTSDYVTVDYVASLPMEYEDLERILNEARRSVMWAPEHVEAENAKYAAAMKAYEADTAAYEEYLAACDRYTAAMQAYEDARTQHAQWQKRSRDYENYLAQYAAYEREVEEYNNYLTALGAYQEAFGKYQIYLADKARYDALNAEYQAALESEELRKMYRQIEALDFIFTPIALPDGETRSFYNSIMGGTVTYVLEQRDTLIKYAGVEQKAVELAERTTYALRDELLPRLNAQRSSVEGKYNFYITYYESLRDNVTDLFRALDYLYRNDKVMQAVKSKDRVPQYNLLLAQFYYLCNALNDGPVGNYDRTYKLGGTRYDFDATYTIKNDKKAYTPAQLVGNTKVPDISGDPTPLAACPTIPTPPTPPTPVENPGDPPKAPKNPVAPQVVAPPGEEPEVPSLPLPPEEVKQPEAPKPYVPTAEEQTILDAIERGELAFREVPEPCAYPAKISVRKYFRNVRELTVRFFNGEELLFSVDGMVGDDFPYPGEEPKKTRTGYTCTFLGWVDKAGGPITFSAIDPGDSKVFDVYANYREVPNPYPVVWIVEGERYEEMCPYDAIPVFQGTPEKAPEGERCFRFTGWDTEPVPMTEKGATYTAQFEQNLFVTWILASGETRRDITWRGDIPVFGEDPERPWDGQHCYRFTGWDRPITAMEEDTSYTAQFEQNLFVTWRLPFGKVRRDITWRGDIPEFGEDPVRERDGQYLYRFTGWDRPITAMEEDTYYTALFEAVPLLPFTNGQCGSVDYGEVYTADCRFAGKTPVDPSLLFACAAEEGKGVVLRLSSCTISLEPDEVYLLRGATRLTAAIAQTALRFYTFRVDLFAGDEALEGGGALTVSVTGESSHLTALEEGGPREIRFETGERNITFPFVFGMDYELEARYSLGIIPSEEVSITLDSATARPGTRVKITLGELPEGMYVEQIYVLCADGSVLTAEGGVFTMPTQDVSVGATLRYYEFTVTFIADGRTVATRSVRYGETPELPIEPLKPSDEAYLYSFLRWDKPIGPITEDTVYTAIFTYEPIPVHVTPPSKLAKLLDTLVAVGVVGIVLLVGGTVTLIVVLRRKKKRKKAENSEKS